MMRWLTLLVVSAGLTLGACGSKEKKTEQPTEPAFQAKPDQEALLGSWSDGANTIQFDSNGSYRWDDMRQCGAPPCPTQTTTGTWSIRHGKIYLSPAGGTDEVIEFGFVDQQTGLSLSSNKQSKSWSLKRM